MFRYRTVRHLSQLARTGKISRGAEFYLGRKAAERVVRGSRHKNYNNERAERKATEVHVPTVPVIPRRDAVSQAERANTNWLG